MAQAFIFSREELARAEELRDTHKNERDYRAALIFILMATGLHTAKDLAKIFGLSERMIFNDINKIRHPELVNNNEWGGGNNHLLTVEEETKFLNKWMSKAENGQILTMPDLHIEYNKLVGKNTPKSTFYRLLKRHNWRKVLPDTKHPKSNPEAQEEFKKKLCRWNWRKST
jgi:transposase